MDVDPLSAVVDYLSADAALVSLTNGQIAVKHRFGLSAGRGWTISPGTGALQVRYVAGGVPDLYGEVQRIRVEARCYGVDQEEAGHVYRRLVGISRETRRELVHANGYTAMLYFFEQDQSPEFLFDPDLELDMVMAFYVAEVAETEVTT